MLPRSRVRRKARRKAPEHSKLRPANRPAPAWMRCRPQRRLRRWSPAALYGRNGCATCHSIGGEGNPRYRLDGCGDRWDVDELRAWVTGTGVAAGLLGEGMRRRKSRYKNLPAGDLDAIVLYLATIRKSER